MVSGLVLTRGCKPVAECAGRSVARRRAKATTTTRASAGAATNSPTARAATASSPCGPRAMSGAHRHYHVKVQAANGPVLTTQLYFPDDPGNARDPLFRPAIC